MILSTTPQCRQGSNLNPSPPRLPSMVASVPAGISASCVLKVRKVRTRTPLIWLSVVRLYHRLFMQVLVLVHAQER